MNRHIKAIIIEDDLSSISLLSMMINEYCPDVILVGTAMDVSEGIKLIHSVKPDIVFLDVELGDRTSFEILDAFKSQLLNIVFITGHDVFALKAFQYDAVHFILKPFSVSELRKSIEKVKNQMEILKNFESRNTTTNVLKSNVLAIPNSTGVEIFQIEDIMYIESDQSYSTIFLANGSKSLVSKSLKDFEASLPIEGFYRIHHSFIVNLKYIVKYTREDGDFIILKSGKSLPIARRRKEEFLQKILK